MNDFKSVQGLIIKAALYDGISTTISADERIGGRDVLRIMFSKGTRCSATYIDLDDRFRDPEGMALYSCKDALHRLIWGPYEEIECERKN
jgi:hypothetical protein